MLITACQPFQLQSNEKGIAAALGPFELAWTQPWPRRHDLIDELDEVSGCLSLQAARSLQLNH